MTDHLTLTTDMTESTFIPVGVDIAKQKFDAARLQDGKYRHKVFHNTPEGFVAFLAWLANFGPAPVRVVMDATGAYSVPLAEFLADQGVWVSVVNPAQIKAFAKSELCRAKTDPADAKLIARFGRERQPPRWNPPPPALRELQALLRRVEQVLEMRQMERNRLHTAHPAAQASLQALIATLDQELATLRATIRQKIDDDPDLRGRRDLLASIPGLGDATIAHLLVLFSPHYGFHNAKQVVAYIGLAPNPHQSGNTQQTRLSKIGDALLRKVLYLPALVAWQHNPAIRAFCERLKANGKSGKAVACAAMRKLVHIAFGVLKSGQPFDPQRALAK
jgi:transposase